MERLTAGLKRHVLTLKANFTETFFDVTRALNAWERVLIHETTWLPYNDPRRATAIINTAFCHIESCSKTNLEAATRLLEKALSLVARNPRWEHEEGRALWLSGRALARLGATTKAIDYLERAEKALLNSATFSHDRINNLNDLANCYDQVGRKVDAQKARKTVEAVWTTLVLSRPRRTNFA
jgi:tetratricopeptide (TPR) repeat protein